MTVARAAQLAAWRLPASNDVKVSTILRSYDLHANSFMSKPLDFDEFMSALKAIEGFWLSIVKLPDE